MGADNTFGETAFNQAISVKQSNIFGGADTIAAEIQPHELPKAKNDWAFCIQVLLLYKKPVDFFTIVKEFGLIKFQTRMAEILTVYPTLIEVKEGLSRKRLGRVVAVNKYFIHDKKAAISLYMSVFNQKAVFCKMLTNKKRTHEG